MNERVDRTDRISRTDQIDATDRVAEAPSSSPSLSTTARSGPERWLYAGERVVVTESLSEGWIAVTTHRLLVYTPGTDGPVFTGYERLNVRGVQFDTDGDGAYLASLPRLVVYGFVFLGGWAALQRAGLDALLASDTGGSLAAAGMGGVFETVRIGLQFLETALLAIGLLALVAGTIFGALYLYSRTPQLVVEVAGAGAVRHSVLDGRAANVSLDAVRAVLLES